MTDLTDTRHGLLICESSQIASTYSRLSPSRRHQATVARGSTHFRTSTWRVGIHHSRPRPETLCNASPGNGQLRAAGTTWRVGIDACPMIRQLKTDGIARAVSIHYNRARPRTLYNATPGTGKLRATGSTRRVSIHHSRLQSGSLCNASPGARQITLKQAKERRCVYRRVRRSNP